MATAKKTSSIHTSNHTSRSWQKGNFQPTLFQLQDNNCGITIDLTDSSPLEIFKLFFDQKLIQMIVDETNKFQADSTAKHSSSSH